MYGHLDKQPEFTGWRNDLGPWTPARERPTLRPRRRRRRLHAIYTRDHRRPRRWIGRASAGRVRGPGRDLRESGSATCPPTSTRCARAGASVGLVVCLDGRRQLRPALADHQPARHGQRRAEGGDPHRRASPRATPAGLVPSSFRILRHVLDRLEDSATGPAAAEKLPLQRAGLAPGAGAEPPRPSWATRSGSASLGLRRRWHQLCRPPPTRSRCCSTPGGPRSASPAPMASRAGQRRQRAAALHRLQAQPAPAAAGGRPPANIALKALLETTRPTTPGHLPPRPPGAGATGWNAPRAWRRGWSGPERRVPRRIWGAPVGYISQGG